MLTQWVFMCAGSTNVYFYLGVSREAKICKLSLHGALCMSLPRECSGFHSALLGGPWGAGQKCYLLWSLHERFGMTWFLFSSSLIIYDAGWMQEESCSKAHPLEKGAPSTALLLRCLEFPSAVSLRSNAAVWAATWLEVLVSFARAPLSRGSWVGLIPLCGFNQISVCHNILKRTKNIKPFAWKETSWQYGHLSLRRSLSPYLFPLSFPLWNSHRAVIVHGNLHLHLSLKCFSLVFCFKLHGSLGPTPYPERASFKLVAISLWRFCFFPIVKSID